ncbi:hypothetical protein OG292_15340 [Streptomyces sp. NBC_01511]
MPGASWEGKPPAYGFAVAEHVPKTDTEMLRLLLESLRRWRTAEPDGLS